jgi:hypothetical protein
MDTNANETIEIEIPPLVPNENDEVKCGVCDKEFIGSKWIKHIEEAHNYLAWKYGDPVIVSRIRFVTQIFSFAIKIILLNYFAINTRTPIHFL